MSKTDRGEGFLGGRASKLGSQACMLKVERDRIMQRETQREPQRGEPAYPRPSLLGLIVSLAESPFLSAI